MRLADFILANVEPILVEWESFARGIWPKGAKADPAELRDEAGDILRLTGLDMQGDQTNLQQAEKSKALSAGFQVHLPKPVDPHDLTSAIARLAGRTA